MRFLKWSKRKKMQADFDITGYAPDLVVGKNGRQAIIRCEIVDQPSEGPRRSGKYIHLGLTAADAMRLLAHLQGAQKQFGWPIPQGIMIDVPPPIDRH
jgi:hypothetical protein